MKIEIRPMEPDEVGEIVKAWNRMLVHDRLDEKTFRDMVLEDANYEKGSTLVATYEGNIVGFMCAVAREGVSGADNRGTPEDRDRGYLKAIFVIGEFQRRGIGSTLLQEGINYLRSKGKRCMRVVTYTGRYFFPGVDLRYEPALKFFESEGFTRKQIIDDVYIETIDPNITEFYNRARQKAEKIGVSVVDYEPSMLNAMRIFVQKLNMVWWFPEGWEEWYKSEGNKVVAIIGDEIVGWASFGTANDIGWFGPTAVLEEMRHNGIGSWMLMESVLQMKNKGAKRVFASWANTPFYIANGWKIYRQYAVFEKSWDI